MAKASSDDMHKLRDRLDKFERFDGKETKHTEHAWRKRFEITIASYDPDDSQKLGLWKEMVEVDSLAWDWMEQMEAESRIGTWAELVDELGKRWPRPDPKERT